VAAGEVGEDGVVIDVGTTAEQCSLKIAEQLVSESDGVG
jgi:hypothetical protein